MCVCACACACVCVCVCVYHMCIYLYGRNFGASSNKIVLEFCVFIDVAVAGTVHKNHSS